MSGRNVSRFVVRNSTPSMVTGVSANATALENTVVFGVAFFGQGS